MKIQNLAVIFIIIILPISLILSAYVQNQVKTLELQMSYDTKLTNATYDAVKAFQLNTINSSTSDLANSKIRDIQASVNTFFNSVANKFNLAGYNEDILKNYVPALVYTMYDGYYIYSPFTNTILKEDEGSTYKDEDKITDLKPYIHYSSRYKKSDVDVVITYSLDNYITVKGIIAGKAVDKSGYLIDINNISTSNGGVSYRGVPIEKETLTEVNAIYTNPSDKEATQANYIYTKINGVKYYTSDDGNTWFSILNGNKYEQKNIKYKTESDAAQRYYKEAEEFTEWVNDYLDDITPQDAVDENGKPLYESGDASDLFNHDYKIFRLQDGDVSIEDPNSNFDQHRLAVMRYSIEKNLSIAIANYNNYTNVKTNFQMPRLKEDEWDKILNNVSVISFMQGLSIGGKVYNGYSVVANSKTEEVVNVDAIYVTTRDGEYHRATEIDLEKNRNITGAFLNTDFERKSITGENSVTYFYPHGETGSYSSIVTQNNVDDLSAYGGSIYRYLEGKGELAQKYYTALGRERYTMYKTNNNIEEENKKFLAN